ncbi:MAG: hypothetical protein AB7E37_08145 [Candidatus Altimarinota bacterium]
MADEQTEGMIKMPDGSFLGSVGVTLDSKDIEEADYTGGTVDDKTANKIIDDTTKLIDAGATTLLSSNIIKSKVELASMILSVKNAEMIRDSNILVAKVMTNLGVILAESANKSLEANSLSTEYLGTSQLASNIVQGQLVNAVKDLKDMLKDKTSTVNASGGTFNLDTTPIVNALKERTENQKETNAKIVENIDKKNEHLDFQKDGISTLKDSSGNVIKPREVQAKNNAEHNIYKTAENTYNWKDSTEETLNHLDDSLNGSGAGEGGIGLDEASLFKLLDKFLLHNKDVYATENTSKVFKKENTQGFRFKMSCLMRVRIL